MRPRCKGLLRLRLFPAFAAAAFVPISDDSLAQTNAVNATRPAANSSETLEPGDVYLPSSRVYAFVGKTGFGHEHGVIGQLKQGRIDLSGAREPGSLIFDVSSFAADTPEARKFVGLPNQTDASTQQQVNANMRGSEVLDVARFPSASFTIKQVAKLSQPSKRNLPQIQLNGDFTLHGVTKPIQVVAEIEEQGGWTHLMGGFTMLQSQYGITPFTKAFGAVGVADQLTIWGDLWISKQRQLASR
jgi:polyisoprenoid-binding protein YceI